MLSPQSLYRGLYVRIAQKLRVDPSYVSRVARGERHSRKIENALQTEIEGIGKRLGVRHESRVSGGEKPTKRLGALLSKNRSSLRRQWLRHSLADPNLKKLKIAAQKRAEPILPVIDEAMKAMTLSLEEMARAPMKAAEQHGRVRHNQGLAPTALVEELYFRCRPGAPSAYGTASVASRSRSVRRSPRPPVAACVGEIFRRLAATT